MNKKEKAPQKTDKAPGEGKNTEARLNTINTEIDRYKEIKRKGKSKKDRNEIQKEIDRLNHEKEQIEKIREEISSSFENNNQTTNSDNETVNSETNITPASEKGASSSEVKKIGIWNKINNGFKNIFSPRKNKETIIVEDNKEGVTTDSPENTSETSPETNTASIEKGITINNPSNEVSGVEINNPESLNTTINDSKKETPIPEETISDPENETTENPTTTSPEITTTPVNENESQTTDGNDEIVGNETEIKTANKKKEKAKSSNLKFKLIGEMGIGGKISSGIRKILSPETKKEDGKTETNTASVEEEETMGDPGNEDSDVEIDNSKNLDTTISNSENETPTPETAINDSEKDTSENPTTTSPEITTTPVNENENKTTKETTPLKNKDEQTDKATLSNPENENPTGTNPETITSPINRGENREWDNRQPRVSPEMIMPFFEPQNSGFFSRMSRKAKEIMTNAYEGIYQIPRVNKLVGKMEIAYNQFWIDIKQQKASELKDRYDSLDLKNQFINQARDEMERTSQMLAENGFSGAGNMAMRADKMQREQIKIENKKDRLQTRIEKRENRIKLFTNARDAIADRLITHYERKLSPIESKLEALKEKQNEVELFCIGTDVRIDEQYSRIKQLEEIKTRIEKSFIDRGLSDRKIRKDSAVKELSQQINNLYLNVQVQKAQNAERRRIVNEKVAKIDAKAAPYRDKKNKFIRVKDNRPIDFNLKGREEIREFGGSEQTESHPRIENQNRYYYGGESDYESEGTRYDYRESSFENMENISGSIAKYNTYIETNPNKNHLKINEQELLRATRMFSSTQMTIENFKRLISQYYKAKKIPESEYIQIINNYKK